tara:strand:- start:429 stop:1907 length:1479 start_codon:yes stop_codon:yes gene_type:complete
MQLTKTNYIQYLRCPESLWLLKNKPDTYPNGEFSLFLEKLIKEGYEVEEYAKMLFPNGINLPDNCDSTFTKEKLKDQHRFYFQPSFLTDSGAFARIDILEKLNNNTYHIFEVKSSTSIKKDSKHNHLKDISFQKYVCENSGLNISKLSIIYLNKDFIRNGNIKPEDLLVVEDVTEQVESLYDIVKIEVNNALNFIIKKSISENQCTCKFNTRTNHCDSFSYFNKNVTDFSIYEINRISKKKIIELLKINQYKIEDVDTNNEVNFSEFQLNQIDSVKNKSPLIDKENIKKTLKDLEFPLHFIDYETYPSAVPKIDKLGPHKQHVFQVSIHSLSKNGELTHFEYLADKMELNNIMLLNMKKFSGCVGTFISWHASFEKSRNKDLINWFPEFRFYLEYMNFNMFDLEDIFKKYYIDYRFNGSTSIKNVLPILCPHLSYSNLEINNGTMALDTWGRMVLDNDFNEDVILTRNNLLSYCALDTKAMVEIYFKLINIK